MRADSPSTSVGPRPSASRNRVALTRIEQLEVRQLLSAGSLDNTYGTAGISRVTPLIGGQLAADVVDTALQSDGKLVVLLSTSDSGSAITRLDANGAIDTTFGNGGVTTPRPDASSLSAIDLTPDGKILAVGSAGNDGVALRYLSNGTIDTSFGSSGVVSLSNPNSGELFNAFDVVVRSDGRIVIGGDGGGNFQFFAFFGLSASGQIDSTFAGSDGFIEFGFGGADDDLYQLALLGDGRVVASGRDIAPNESQRPVVSLLTAAGALDASFDGDGLLSPGGGLSDLAGSRIAVQGGNQILLLDSFFGPTTVAVARYNLDGSIDTTFGGGDGIATLSTGVTAPIPPLADVSVDEIGLPLLAYGVSGATGQDPDVVHVRRLNSDGSIDTSFADVAALTRTTSIFQATARINVTQDHKVLVTASSGSGQTVVARYDATHPLVPSLTSTASLTAAATQFDLTVSFVGDSPVDTKSLGLNNVRVKGPGGFDQLPTAFTQATDSQGTRVTYTFPAPGGSLDAGDNGTYQLLVESRQIRDVNGNLVPVQQIGTFNVAIGLGLPDIALADATFASGLYFPGDQIPVSFLPVVSNGSVASFGLRILLSLDNVAGNSDDVVLVNQSAATSGAVVRSLGPIPDSLQPGDYYLIAQIDPSNQIVEADEANNIFATKVPVVQIRPPRPDLPARQIGGLDPSFGTGGTLRPGLGFTGTAGVVQEGDGGLLIAGFTPGVGGRDVAVASISTSNERDTNFGAGNGVASYDLRNSDDQVSDFKLLPDGRILVAGTSGTTGGPNPGLDFFVSRLTSTGQLDTSFGNGGTAIIDFAPPGQPNTPDTLRSIYVDDAGRIYLSGRTAFGGGSGSNFAMVRLTADGVLDSTFGSGGHVATDIAGGEDGIQSVLVTSGSVFATGFATTGSQRHLAVAKYSDGGVLDASFGVGGVVTVNAGGTDERANAVAISAKNQVVLAGLTSSGTPSGGNFSSQFAVVRLTSRGKLDSKFGVGGIALANFGQPAAANDVQILADGRVLASGITSAALATGAASRFDLAVARFTATGGLDTSFSDDGLQIISTAPTDSSSSLAGASIEQAARDGAAFGLLADGAFSPLAGDAAQSLDDFQNSSEGKLSGLSGGGALLAGSDGTTTVIASIVTSGAELSGTLSANLPVAVIGGAKGSAAVSVANLGDVVASGSLSIVFYTSSDQTLGSGDRQITTLTGKPVALKPLSLHGKAKVFKVKFTFPTDLTDGSYFILADVNSDDAISELNPNNDEAFSDRSVQIAAPFVDLTGSGIAQTATLTLGKANKLTLTLQNDGNISVNDVTDLKLYFSTDQTLDSNDATVDPAAVNLKINPASSRLTKVTVTPPTLDPGSYFLFVLIDPNNAILEKNKSNNLISSDQTAVIT